MSWQPPATQLLPILEVFRQEGGKSNMTALHAFLLVAAKPLTVAELAAAMKVSKTTVIRATEPFCRVPLEEGGIREPRVHLFNRKHFKSSGGTSYRLTLTRKARQMLQERGSSGVV